MALLMVVHLLQGVIELVLFLNAELLPFFSLTSLLAWSDFLLHNCGFDI